LKYYPNKKNLGFVTEVRFKVFKNIIYEKKELVKNKKPCFSNVTQKKLKGTQGWRELHKF